MLFFASPGPLEIHRKKGTYNLYLFKSYVFPGIFKLGEPKKTFDHFFRDEISRVFDLMENAPIQVFVIVLLLEVISVVGMAGSVVFLKNLLQTIFISSKRLSQIIARPGSTYKLTITRVSRQKNASSPFSHCVPPYPGGQVHLYGPTQVPPLRQ